jgi:hypothetical protein
MIILWRIIFGSKQNVEKWMKWSQLAWLEDLTTRHESISQVSKMTKSCTSEALYSSAKSLMKLEFHWQASKRPNRGFANARYLWVEGFTNCSKYWLFENMILQRFMIHSDQGYLAFIHLKLSIMAAWKKDSLIDLRPSIQGYVANCERINGIFVT